MNELTLELTEVSPQVFCGEDESNIKYIKTLFPKLKIVARGSKLIVFGEEHLLKDFQEQMEKTYFLHFQIQPFRRAHY